VQNPKKEHLLQPESKVIRTSPFYCTYLPRRAIGILAVMTLCGILVAGLWPFHSPKNDVHWLENENGLRFGRYGTVLSSGQFELAGSDGPSCSLEIWLSPARAGDTGTFLAFYNSSNRRQFSLQQDYIDLALQRDIGGEHDQDKLYIHDVFHRKQALITVTSDGQDTAVYIDGNLVTRSLRFGLSIKDLVGELIVADAPLQSHSWSGQLRGLAIYKSQLTADQVAHHYQDWTRKGKTTVAERDSTLALYLFAERTGKVIHNQVRSGIGLYIPDRYLVVDQTLLEPPWREFRRQRNYLKNVLINIAGFVPLGFFFGAYFMSVRQIKHGALATIVFGALVSLAIEVLQAYLPTRDSGVTDVITNTLGTCVGVVLYQAAAVPLARVLAARHYGGHSGTSPSQGNQ